MSTHSDEGGAAVPVRDRLLQAAKVLFSIHGFENTSTAVIARHANTSESQLIKHFGSKEGLLEAIFEQGWQKLEFIGQALTAVPSPSEKLRMIFRLALQGLDSDQPLKELMLFEGRRIRRASSGTDILVTSGYLRFAAMVESVLSQIIRGTPLEGKLTPAALTSAMIGMFESLLRDQVLARRVDFHTSATNDEVRVIFELFVERILAR